MHYVPTNTAPGESMLAVVDNEKTMSLQRVLTAPILIELRLALPSIAEELNCEPEDLYVCDRLFPCLHATEPGVCDVPYKAVGHDVVPFVHHCALHDTETPGWGIIYYKNKLHPQIRYAVYAQQGSYGDQRFLLVKRGELFRLARAANKQRKENVKEIIAPVLAPGVLTSALESTVGFFQKAKDIRKYGVRVKHGLLLTGSPGNGKTMLCRYLQQMADRYSWGWSVVTASDIDKAFKEVQLSAVFNKYPFTFFDDIDISYLHREKGNAAVACAILAAMDGVTDIKQHHLVRVFTTNEDISSMDAAFARPGRIDRIIKIEKPDRAMREQLVASWHEEIINNIDVEELLDESEEMSFADLEGVKSCLVTAKVVRGAPWNITTALDEFLDRRAESATYKLLGFDASEKKRKKKKKDRIDKLLDRLKPPVKIGDDELDRSVDTDKPVRAVPAAN